MANYSGFKTTAIGFFILNTSYVGGFKTAAIGFFMLNTYDGSFKTAKR